MGDASFLTLLRSPGPPLYIVALIAFVMAFKTYPLILARVLEGRRDRAKIEGEQYERLDARYRRLEERCDRLEQAEEECRSELASAKGRIAELEGYNQGRGSARQEAAGVTALDRLADRKKP